MDKEESLNFVKRFKKLITGKFRLDKLIFFGSRARGNFNEDSDFDLIVVSDEFKGIKSYKRGFGLRRDWGYDYPVDFICLTLEEFEKMKNRPTVVNLAVKEGIEV